MIIYEVTFKSPLNIYTFSFGTKKEAIRSIQYADDCEILDFRKVDYNYIKGEKEKETAYQTKAPYKIINN